MSRDDRLTLAEARAVGQGSSHLDADPTYARRFVRKVSPPLSWAIVRWTGLAADDITFASLGIGVIGGLAVSVGTLPFDVAALFLLQGAYLLDVADGEVARIRGTAGKRGTYLDLIGHVLQNVALYTGASISLLAVTDRAPWAIGVSFLALAFSLPFGYYARLHVLRVAGDHPEHPGRFVVEPWEPGLAGGIRSAYRRVKFIWSVPASMNLFCVAIMVDCARFLGGAQGPLAVPVLMALFGSSLAAKQVYNAFILLRLSDW